MSEENLALWERHFKPHKDAVKSGLKGLSAIDPMWTIREATEEWGPMGGAWGFVVVDEQIISFEKGVRIHQVKIRLWYPGMLEADGDRFPGVTSFGATTMSGYRKSGDYFVDEDAAKKSVTDALSKALSWLGFGGAVFMGMFDCNKYADLRPTDSKQKPEPKEEEKDKSLNSRLVESLKVDQLVEQFHQNVDRGMKVCGKNEYINWHKRVFGNFYGVDENDISAETKGVDLLTDEQLLDFIEKQGIKLEGKEE